MKNSSLLYGEQVDIKGKQLCQFYFVLLPTLSKLIMKRILSNRKEVYKHILN